MPEMPLGVQELAVSGKRVFVRVDFNVPVDKNQVITDDTRIQAALPTIEFLIAKQAKVILASHFGRPKGEVQEKYRLDPVARRLSELLGLKVIKSTDCIGPEVQELVAQLQPGQVLLLENLRFHPEEEENSPEFAQALASLADLYVNDAFGAAHRAHASTAEITNYLPSAAGFLMQKEVEALSKVLSYPDRPFMAIVGGAKVSDKIKLLENFLDKVDILALGGGMANTFLSALGFEVGRSLVEEQSLDFAREIMETARKKRVEFILPQDVVVAEQMAADAPFKVVPVQAIPRKAMILDIGPETIRRLHQACQESRTVLWNGPVGVFEIPLFAQGTETLAQILAQASAVTLVGGGDTVAAVEQAGVVDQMDHISTGGGASLEFLEGRELPGVAALAAK